MKERVSDGQTHVDLTVVMNVLVIATVPTDVTDRTNICSNPVTVHSDAGTWFTEIKRKHK